VKSKLELNPHLEIDGEYVIEVTYNGQLIATVCGMDGPGVRVISRHPMSTNFRQYAIPPNVMEVRVGS